MAHLPYGIPQHSSFDYTSNPTIGSRAHEESNEFFGLHNDNHYDQDVGQAHRERSVNRQYEALARAGAFVDYDYAHDLPPAGHLVLKDEHVQCLRGWNATYEKEFRILWQRCWKNKHFIGYRTAQPKPEKVAKYEDKKWTHVREEMFFRACVRHRPVGREKVKHNSSFKGRDKQMGRNELVADRINEWLCLKEQLMIEKVPIPPIIPPEELALTRKQISSHLQVLKNKFKHEDPWVIDKYLGADTKKVDHARANTTRGHAHSSRFRSSYVPRTDGYRNALAAAHARPMHFNGNIPTLPSQSAHNQQNLFEPADFRMYMRSGCEYKGVEGHECGLPNHCKHKTIHMYTKTQENVRGPDTPLSLTAVAGAIPDLIHGQDCPILHANASMSLPSQALGKEQRQNLELSIDSSFMTVGPIEPDADWYVRTWFFEAGQPATWYNFEGGKQVEQESALQTINVDKIGHAGRYRHSIPFGSSYWVNKVSKLNELQTACEKAHSHATIASGGDDRDTQHQRTERQYRDNIKSVLSSITALQEVFVRPRDHQPQRVFMIYWQFRPTTYPNEMGTTVFRNLHLVKSEPEIGANDSLNVNLHHEQTHQYPGNILDASSGYGTVAQHHNASHLDALASAAFAAAPEHDSIYDIDWSAFDHLETTFDGTAQALAGTEPYSSFVDVPFTSYTGPSIDDSLMPTYDLHFGVHQQPHMEPLSTSHSNATSPTGEQSFGSDYLGGDRGESQPSTAASSYATSAQYTPASFQSPHEFSQQCHALTAFNFDPHTHTYDTHQHAHSHHHTHAHAQAQQYDYSPHFEQVPTLRPSHTYEYPMQDSQASKASIGMEMDTQDNEETLFPGHWNYADGVSQQTKEVLSQDVLSQNMLLQHCSPDLEQPTQQYGDLQETQEAQAGAGAASVAHMYDANFFANVSAEIAGEGTGSGVWDE